MRALQRNKRVEAYATATASLTATAVIPVTVGPSWEVKQISVSATGSTTQSSASTYVGTNSSGVFISSTLIANSDTDSTPNVTLRSGESLCCIWTKVSSGSVCKLTIVYDEVGY